MELTNPEYWDCECTGDFIHAKERGNYCSYCDTYAEDQPDSRSSEVKDLYTPNNDYAEKKLKEVK